MARGRGEFKGFRRPLAHMLRWKDVLFGRRLSDGELLSADLPDPLADGYAAAPPVLNLIATLR